MTKDAQQATCQSLTVLRATDKDSADIWKWRNDEQTRLMSLTTDEISWAAHDIWYEKSLLNKNRCLFIGYLNEREKIGMCRFDIDTEQKNAEVSINLNPQYRNRNLSYKLLSAAIVSFSNENKVDLTATIRKENVASIKCFVKCGFTWQAEDNGYNYYKLSVKTP